MEFYASAWPYLGRGSCIGIDLPSSWLEQEQSIPGADIWNDNYAVCVPLWNVTYSILKWHRTKWYILYFENLGTRKETFFFNQQWCSNCCFQITWREFLKQPEYLPIFLITKMFGTSLLRTEVCPMPCVTHYQHKICYVILPYNKINSQSFNRRTVLIWLSWELTFWKIIFVLLC